MNNKWCCVGFIAILILTIFAEYTFGQTNANDQAYKVVPRTQFKCGKRAPGYYADIDTGCQVYHMCDGMGRQFSYSCPNTTLFQQRMLICDHWYMVNCTDSERNFDANLLIGQRDKPFVRDDEHELRTPRPDLLDRPYAPDYSGESFRNQYKNSPALQNSLNDPNVKTDNFFKRPRAPIEQLKPFSVPPYWIHAQQKTSQPKFAALRRREDSFDGGSDLRVASSQDSRRSESDDHVDAGKTVPQQPSLEYTLPFLLPNYNENYTAESANATLDITPTLANIIINVPDSSKFTQQNEVDFPNHRTDSRIDVNEVAKNLISADPIQARILTRPNSIESTINIGNQGTPVKISTTPGPESSDLLPVVTSNDIPQPASGLLPPFDTFNSYDDSTTQGPPIYYEWKIPASGLEPPKRDQLISKVSTQDDNQIPVLPPSESTKPLVNIPIIEKELVPPIYDTNRLTLTKIRIPAIGLEPPKLVPPIVTNESQPPQNHSFPSLAPLNGAIHNLTSASDKSQTPRSVSTSQTASPNDVAAPLNAATTKDTDYGDLQKQFLIPSFTFPLETEQRPGYERDNAVNSFQIKIPDSIGSETNIHWYGESAECPECHPSFLKPGTCEPCIKLR